jgi:hypothetical protein
MCRGGRGRVKNARWVGWWSDGGLTVVEDGVWDGTVYGSEWKDIANGPSDGGMLGASRKSHGSGRQVPLRQEPYRRVVGQSGVVWVVAGVEPTRYSIAH